jgi:hypothetical protein
MTPDSLLPGDRNILASHAIELSALGLAQKTEASRLAQDLTRALEVIVGRISHPIDNSQIATARALLARSPCSLERAVRVLHCPPISVPMVGRHYGLPRYPCKQRCCSYCAERRARDLAAMLVWRGRHYRQPAAVLITCPSKTLFDLPAALGLLRGGIAALRRRRWFMTAFPAGCLAIETPVTADGHRWALHAHGVLELPVDSPALRARCEQAWRAAVGMPGALFSIEPVRDVRALLGYALKLGRDKSWAPLPGDLSPTLMAHLDTALRGRRLTIVWGPSERRAMDRAKPCPE